MAYSYTGASSCFKNKLITKSIVKPMICAWLTIYFIAKKECEAPLPS